MAKPHRMIRLVGLAALLATLSGCDGYPRDWPGLDRPLLGSCPDIRGTYAIGSNDEDGTGRNAGMDSSFFRHVLPPRTAQRWHWETMTIAGNPAERLEITLMRSKATQDAWRQRLFEKGGMGYYEKQYKTMHDPATRWSGSFARMTDAEFQANLDKLYLAPVAQVTLTHGQEYQCDGGWLSGPRLVHDPGPNPHEPRPDQEIGIVRFARDKEGHLVAESVYPEDVFISLWCGDGCKGVSLGTWTMHRWKRWAPAAPAWQGEIERPWAAPFQRPRYGQTPDDPALTSRLADVKATLAPMIAAPARLHDVRVDGQDVVAMIDSPVLTPYHALFETVERARAFTRVTADALERSADGGWRLHLLLGLSPQASGTPLAAIAAQLQPLLPAGCALHRVDPQGAGFVLDGYCPTKAALSQWLRAIETSEHFHRADLETYLVRADGAYDARIRFRER